jgi:glutamine cyclotransferase
VRFTHKLVKIDLKTGAVLGWLDLEALPKSGEYQCWDKGDVLNGIAALGQTLYITGKNWKHIYEIEVVPDVVIDHIPLN